MTSPSAAEVRGSVPVVRGLEWAFNSTNSVWSGELPFNTYYTINGEGPKWRVFRGQFLSSADEEEIAYVADQSEAKAAAQADWEKLSREILNPAFLSAIEASQAEVERLRGDGWVEGVPPSPWSKEWFIAETVHSQRVVLTALPEEYTYDFKTADDTYIMARNIKRWMPFPDSEYVSPATSALTAAQERIAVLEGAEACPRMAVWMGQCRARIGRNRRHPLPRSEGAEVMGERRK